MAAKKKPLEASGLKDDPDLMAAYHARQAKMQQLLTVTPEQLSIADRLTRTVDEQVFTVDWPSADGPIPVRFRIPTSTEADRLTFLRMEIARIAGTKDPVLFEKVFFEFQDLLAFLCKEPSMTPEWFREGMIPTAYLYQMADEVLFESGRRIGEVRPFRLDAGRKAAMDPVQPDGEETARTV